MGLLMYVMYVRTMSGTRAAMGCIISIHESHRLRNPLAYDKSPVCVARTDVVIWLVNRGLKNTLKRPYLSKDALLPPMHSATSTSPAATSCVTARAVSRLPMSLAKNPACRLPSASAELISAMTATRVKGPFPRVVGCGPGAGGVVKVWTADQAPCSVR